MMFFPLAWDLIKNLNDSRWWLLLRQILRPDHAHFSAKTFFGSQPGSGNEHVFPFPKTQWTRSHNKIQVNSCKIPEPCNSCRIPSLAVFCSISICWTLAEKESWPSGVSPPPSPSSFLHYGMQYEKVPPPFHLPLHMSRSMVGGVPDWMASPCSSREFLINYLL